jgi:hypothetical protein
MTAQLVMPALILFYSLALFPFLSSYLAIMHSIGKGHRERRSGV